MKKNIISRMKSRKNQLVAGVPAMFSEMIPRLYKIGLCAVVALLISGLTTKGLAQTDLEINAQHVAGPAYESTQYSGIVIGGGDLRYPTLSPVPDIWVYEHVNGGKQHLQFASDTGTRTDGGIYVVNGETLQFDGGNDSATGGAISIIASNRSFIFSARLPAWYPSGTTGTFEFINNTAGLRGGAIYNRLSTVDLRSITFADNQSLGTGGLADGGGAIYNDEGILILNNDNHFERNTSARFGGAIYNQNDGNRRGTLTVQAFNTTNTFIENVAAESGGAIYNNAGIMDFLATATNSTYSRNSSYLGAAAGSPGYTSTTSGTTTSEAYNLFQENKATSGPGGAIYDRNGILTFNATATPNSGTLTITVEVNSSGAGADPPTPAAPLRPFVIENYSISPLSIRDANAIAGEFIENTAADFGGAIYSTETATLAFNATANTVTATANATATASNHNLVQPVADAEMSTRASADGGIFTLNNAGKDGGAIYFDGSTLTFAATARNATANATATARAIPNADNQSEEATALARADAEVIANAGIFKQNTAGVDTGGTGNYDGRGGAIYATPGGTLRFDAVAYAASATANADPNASREGGPGRNGTAGANATAFATVSANAGEFEDNRAKSGGAIYNEGSTLTFTAEIIVNDEDRNAYAWANPTPGSYSNNTFFELGVSPTVPLGEPVVETAVGTAFDPDPINDPYFGGPAAAVYGSRAYAKSTAYGSTFRDNKAVEYGGAIYSEGGKLIFITDSSVTATARTNGSMNEYQTTENTIEQDTEAKNSYLPDLRGTSLWYGNSAAIADVAAALFTKNIAGKHGGAIYVTDGGSMEVVGITRFDANWAGMEYDETETDPYIYVGGGHGGAIYNNSETLVFMASTAKDANGEPVYSTGYSTFTSNVAERGGAIYNHFDTTDGEPGVNGVVTFWNDSLRIDEDTYQGRKVEDANFLGGVFGGSAGFGNQAIFGGALFNAEGGTMTLVNVYFTHNLALEEIEDIPVVGGGLGGAIYNEGEKLDIYGGFFANNTAILGGAIYHTAGAAGTGGSLTIDNKGFETENRKGLVFEYNKAEKGGAIYNDDTSGTLTLEGIEFYENQASEEGGAIWSSGTVSVIDSFFLLSNSGDIVGKKGGAIFNTASDGAGDMTFHNTSFSSNVVQTTVGGEGGAIFNEEGTLTFTGSNVFARNNAHSGGAIYNQKGEVNINGGDFYINAEGIIYGNTATYGAAIYNEEGELNLTDVNFQGNVAGEAGGAIYSKDGEINVNVVNANPVIGRTANSTGVTTHTDSIHFEGTNVFNVDVAAGRTLTQRGGMFSEIGAAVTIDKDGSGTWRHEGVSNLSTGTPTFTVLGGTFDLAITTASDSVLNLGERGTFELEAETTLQLGASATPSATRGSLLKAKGVTTGADSNIIADQNFTLAPFAAVVSAGKGTIATGLNDDDYTKGTGLIIEGETFITATGFDFLKGSVLDFETPTAAWDPEDPTTDGPFLWTNHSGTAGTITVSSDFYVVIDEESFKDDDGHIVLMETNGTFDDSAFGTLYLDGDPALGTGFDRLDPASTIVALALDKDDTQIVLKVIDNGRADLYWIGTDGTNPTHWNVSLKTPPTEKSKNWFGYIGGTNIGQTIYLDDDTVYFADYLKDGTTAVTQKNVVLQEDAKPRLMYVTGEDYKFDLNGNKIIATSHINGGGEHVGGNIDFKGSKNAKITMNGGSLSATGNASNSETGNISFRGSSGAEITMDSGSIEATNDIHFGTATLFVEEGEWASVKAKNITFADYDEDGNLIGRSMLDFATGGLTTDDEFTFLTLELTAEGTITVNSNIRVHEDATGELAQAIEDGAIFILVDSNATLTHTGTLFMGDDPFDDFERDPDGDKPAKLGLVLQPKGSLQNAQLVLDMVASDTNSAELVWTGADPGEEGLWDINFSENWIGTVGGYHVTTYLDGDNVYFRNSYIDKDGNPVTLDDEDKIVTLATDVSVASMTVTGDKFEFTLGGKKITSTGIGQSVATNGDIHFGSAKLIDISGTDAIKATGDITFTTGTLEFDGVATITAGGNIVFDKATFGSKDGLITEGTTITAEGTDGTITFAGDNRFYFDLNDMDPNTDDVLLTLVADSVSGVGSGIIDVYGISDDANEWEQGDYFILIDSPDGVAKGTLYIEGEEYEGFKRGAGGLFYTLAVVDSTDTEQLRLEVVDSMISLEITWAGTVNSTWRDAGASGAENWRDIAGSDALVFLNGDTVTFGDEYLSAAKTRHDVENKNVQTTTGVTVESMTVTGSDYEFDLAGGITATGDIIVKDTVNNTTFKLGTGARIIAGGHIINSGTGTTISLNVGEDEPVIGATGSIALGSATLNIIGFSGEDKHMVIGAGTTLSGFEPASVTIDGAALADYFTAYAYLGDEYGEEDPDGNKIWVDSSLSWYSTNPNPGAHGDFTVTGEFTLGEQLRDNSASTTKRSDWSGNELNKMGPGTLILTYENNTYKGPTNVKEGTLQITKINGAGDHKKMDQFVNIDARAFFDMAFIGGTGAPCADKDTNDVVYGQQIRGAGTLVKSAEGIIVFEHSNVDATSSFTGNTHIKKGGIIIEHLQALGTGDVIVAKDATFTIGVGGTYSQRIVNPTGATEGGNVYINPARTNDTEIRLTGNSTYTGDTILCSGTTVLGILTGTGNSSTGKVLMRDDTQLVFDFSTNGTYGKSILTDGDDLGVVKKNTNTLTLTGASTFEGGTVIESGRLIAKHATNGVVDAVGTGTVTFNKTTGNNPTFEIGVAGEFRNEMIGDGDLYINPGTGTTTFTRDNSDFTGAAFVENGGTALLKNINGIGEYGTVTIASSAYLNIADGGDFRKTTAGQGTLINSAANNVTLHGENAHRNTELQAGTTTTVMTDSALGLGETKMFNNSKLIFGDDLELVNSFVLDRAVTMDTQNFEAAIAKTISGDGNLTKIGDGNLILSGANTFNGLNVNEGRLTAMSQDALGRVGGEVKVHSDATLQVHFNDVAGEQLRRITGTTSGTPAGTFVKSGNGRMNVDYVFNTKAFEVQGGSIGVKLGEGLIIAENGFEAPVGTRVYAMYDSLSDLGLSRGSENEKEFEVLRGASGDSIRNFAAQSPEPPHARLNWRAEVPSGTNSLYYYLWLESFHEAYDKYLSDNAKEAAWAVDNLPDDDPLFKSLEYLEETGTTQDVVRAFSELHGEIYETAIFAQVDMQRFFNDSLLRRRIYCEHAREFKALRAQAPGNKPIRDVVQPNRELWVQLTGGGNFRSQIGKYSAYDMGRHGIFTGFEQRLNRHIFGGIAFGYDQGTLKLSRLPSKDRFDAFRMALYGEYQDNDVSVFAYFGYAKNWHNVERQITFLNATAKSEFNDDVLTAGFDIAKTLHWNGLRFVPSIGMSYVNVQTPLVEETGADFASLFVHSNNYTSLRVPIGTRINNDVVVQGVRFTPEFRMFYLGELAKSGARSHTAFMTDPTNTFAVSSGVHGRNGLLVGVGLQAEFLPRVSLGVDYNGELWNGHSLHSVGGIAIIRF